MMSLIRSRKFRRSVAAAGALVVLYIASSGSAFTLMGQTRQHLQKDGDRVIATAEIRPSDLWLKIYSPLVWVCRQGWGEPLAKYWELCPRPAVVSQ
jgi:hypothetical protein